MTRPAWLSRNENRVDVLVGNPPWLSYRHMTSEMQKQFKSLATDRNFWHDETTATHQDLAGLFVARAVERYLKTGGALAFVVPNSLLDRDYWGGFRRGEFDGANISFAPSWDLRRIRPHLFLRGSGVIYATRTIEAHPMPATALIWTGRAPHRYAHADTAIQLRQSVGELTVGIGDYEQSSYAPRFSQGATLVPRAVWRVEEAPSTGLGVPAGRINLRSKRSATEKPPWRDVPDSSGTVESEFVWPTLLGEQIVPFRVLPAERFVIPLTSDGQVLDADNPKIDAYPGLANWMRSAEQCWEANKRSAMTLVERIDHMKGLSQQIPVTQARVVYAKAGMHVAAALVTDLRAVIDHKLYWAAVASQDEGYFLVGVLNAPILTELVRPLMSYGKDERDVDKSVWKLPIPTYDPNDPTHAEIAQLARDLTAEIGALPFRSNNFVTIRRDIRAHVAQSTSGQRLNQLVSDLLGVDERPPERATDLDTFATTPSDLRLIRISSSAPSLVSADIEIDVDCEFDRTGKVYLWGALVRDPATDHVSYHAFGDPSRELNEHALATTFLDWLAAQVDTAAADGRTVRWYHYGGIEARQLTRILGAAVEAMLHLGTDLLTDVIRPDFFAPAGYSLKRLAPAAGASWRSSGATGAQTYVWIEEARGGDAVAWDRLLHYNEDDTRALRALRAAVKNLNQLGSSLQIARS